MTRWRSMPSDHWPLPGRTASGPGGVRAVYLAQDDELDRPVAIKVPNPERVAGPEDVEAYLAEARILARLDHPNIVPVYDVGRTDDGLCYVVSKYIDGQRPRGSGLQADRPSFRESAELVAVVAEALHHAHTPGPGPSRHQAGQHPASTPRASRAWPISGWRCEDEDYGKGAGLAGTPAYMSPEQARGEGHRVDGRSDIFSLGVVFYELLDRPQAVPGRLATRGPRSRSSPPSPARPARSTTRSPRAGADLPEGAGEAGVGAVHHGPGHGRRPAAFPPDRAASGSPATASGAAARPPGSTQEVHADSPTSGRLRLRRAGRQGRSQGAAVVRPARRRLLPRAASRPPRPRRPAREPPVLEDPDRGDRPRRRRSGSA